MVDLTSKELTYLVFYHNRNVSFKVHEVVRSGDSRLEIVPMRIEQFTKWLKGEQSYPASPTYQSYQENTFIEISPNDNQFCYECYYVILIQGADQVKEEIIISTEDSAIVLK